MHSIIALCLMTLLSSVNMLKELSMDPNHYGPYNVSWKKYETCKGPKAKNVSDVAFDFTAEDDKYFALFNLTFPAKTRIDEMKIKVYSSKSNTRNLLWTYNLNDPCQHFVFAKTIEDVFKGHNCVIEKGSYMSKLDLKELTSNFLGPNFFYGDYYIKSNVLNKVGNILCLNVITSFTKKTE